MITISGLSHEEILAQSILFFLAGYDTSANTLALFVYELACHSDIQDRLIKEIDEVMKDEVSECFKKESRCPFCEECFSILAYITVTYLSKKFSHAQI